MYLIQTFRIVLSIPNSNRIIYKIIRNDFLFAGFVQV